MRESARDAQQREPDQSTLAIHQMSGQLKALRAQMAGMTRVIATTVLVPLGNSAKTAAPGPSNTSESPLKTRVTTAMNRLALWLQIRWKPLAPWQARVDR